MSYMHKVMFKVGDVEVGEKVVKLVSSTREHEERKQLSKV